ncbi:MAG: M48 family metalloprotease [Cyanothece sp. SIO1E1]|nr:M48 family metalloprotease [Cyanothece sp. SIO1E1]
MSKFFTVAFHQVRRRWFYGLISLTVVLGLLVGAPRPTQAFSLLDLLFRGVQVIQLSTLSDRQEVALGSQINDRLVGREFRLARNREINSYVDGIGQRLARVSDRPDIPYTFQVVSDNNVNAFATMGGYVYVTTGLMRAADNEGQLASVMGHEIGHIASRHAVKQMRQAALAQGFASAAGLDRSRAVNLGVDLALRRPASRKDEFEADAQGFETMGRAGYAQSTMVDFMEKLAKQPSPPTFLSTHPNGQARADTLRQRLNPATANVGDGLNGAAYRARTRNL